MIRIAYLIDTIASDTEGTQKQLLETIQRLDPTRFSPHLVCLKESEWMRAHPLPCPISTLEYHGFLKRSFPGVVRRLVALIARNRFQILQTVFEEATFVGYLGGRLARPRPVLISARRDIGLGSGNRPWYHALFRLVRPLVNRGFDGFVANSDQIRRVLIRNEWVSPRRIAVFRNGVALADASRDRPQIFRDETPGALWIGIVASLTPVKRHDLLLRALGLIRETLVTSNVHVVVLGEGPERPALERMVVTEGLEGRVHFEGVVTDVSAYLNEIDIGVLCSDREGLSNAILEYMAYSLPVVASDAGGNPELVDGTNGICFPRGNARALGSALGNLIVDPQKRAAMGLASATKAQNDYAWGMVISALESYYEEMVAGQES